jgi:hypothetical protein
MKIAPHSGSDFRSKLTVNPQLVGDDLHTAPEGHMVLHGLGRGLGIGVVPGRVRVLLAVDQHRVIPRLALPRAVGAGGAGLQETTGLPSLQGSRCCPRLSQPCRSPRWSVRSKSPLPYIRPIFSIRYGPKLLTARSAGYSNRDGGRVQSRIARIYWKREVAAAVPTEPHRTPQSSAPTPRAQPELPAP